MLARHWLVFLFVCLISINDTDLLHWCAVAVTVIHSISLTNRIRAKRKKSLQQLSPICSPESTSSPTTPRQDSPNSQLRLCFRPNTEQNGGRMTLRYELLRSWCGGNWETGLDVEIFFEEWQESVGEWRCGRSGPCCCQGTSTWKQVCMMLSPHWFLVRVRAAFYCWSFLLVWDTLFTVSLFSPVVPNFGVSHHQMINEWGLKKK